MTESSETGHRKVLAVLRRAAQAANDHGIGFMAAGVAFWSALALFPAMALMVWLAHHLLGVADARDAVRLEADVVPDSVGDLVAKAISGRRPARTRRTVVPTSPGRSARRPDSW